MTPLLAMTRAAWLYNVRQPTTTLFGFVLPIGIIVVFNFIGKDLLGATDAASQVVPGVLAYSVANASLSTSAMTLTAWRSSGLLARLRLQPVGAGEIIGARFMVSLLVTLLQVAAFVAVGAAFLDLRLPVTFPFLALPAIAIGGLVFFLLGGCIGMTVRSQETVSAGLSLVLLPLGLLSGCFLPLEVLPDVLGQFMELTPLTAMTQLLITATSGRAAASPGTESWAVLFGGAVLLGMLFVTIYRRKTS